jgi:hypothetical protein
MAATYDCVSELRFTSGCPMRAADDVAEIGPHELGIFVGQNIGLHIAEGGFWLVCLMPSYR